MPTKRPIPPYRMSYADYLNYVNVKYADYSQDYRNHLLEEHRTRLATKKRSPRQVQTDIIWRVVLIPLQYEISVAKSSLNYYCRRHGSESPEAALMRLYYQLLKHRLVPRLQQLKEQGDTPQVTMRILNKQWLTPKGLPLLNADLWELWTEWVKICPPHEVDAVHRARRTLMRRPHAKDYGFFEFKALPKTVDARMPKGYQAYDHRPEHPDDNDDWLKPAPKRTKRRKNDDDDEGKVTEIHPRRTAVETYAAKPQGELPPEIAATIRTFLRDTPAMPEHLKSALFDKHALVPRATEPQPAGPSPTLDKNSDVYKMLHELGLTEDQQTKEHDNDDK